MNPVDLPLKMAAQTASAQLPWMDILAVVPNILWVILTGIIYFSLYRPIREQILPNLGSFSAFGVSISVIRKDMDKALDLAKKSPNWQVKVPERDKEQALKRARRNLHLMTGAHILWADDQPENNINESRMFRQCGMTVDAVRNDEEMLKMLGSADYDIIISDIARGAEPDAGLRALQQLHKQGYSVPVIFYIGVFDPSKGTPPYAFGITNRPDELLNLALDMVERQRQ